MSVSAGPEGEYRPAAGKPGLDRAKPDGWRLTAAGALVGIATGGFVAALLAHIRVRAGWSVGAYEPAAALLGALGISWFGARRGAWDGWLAAGAALAAMLLGDCFWALAHAPHGSCWRVPARVLAELGWGNPLSHWPAWPKLLRYGFGVYIGWYVGSAAPGQAGRNKGT